MQLVFANSFTQSGFILLRWNQCFLEEIPLISQEEEIYCQLHTPQLRTCICFAHYWSPGSVQLVSFTFKGFHWPLQKSNCYDKNTKHLVQAYLFKPQLSYVFICMSHNSKLQQSQWDLLKDGGFNKGQITHSQFLHFIEKLT